MSLYLFIEVVTVIVPLIFSFDKNMQFRKNWKSVLCAFAISGTLYIGMDIYFTSIGVWGFNPAYHGSIVILGLPLEEWLFFVTIPYASVFIHYTFAYYFPKVMLGDKLTRFLSLLIMAVLVIVMACNFHKIYTLINYLVLLLVLIFSFFDKAKTINRFYLTFLIILVPFFLINSILTGSFIENEVYWYHPDAILGVKVFTMPVEDIGYAFSLLLLNLLLIAKFQVVFKSRSNERCVK
jgi:lycopene cyclase domain-containing protein